VKVLILGGGFIGSRLNRYLKDKISVTLLQRSELDYTDKKIFTNFLLERSPTVVINCSGYTGSPNVDACETNKPDCLFYNVSVPVQISHICDQHNIKFINVSSGCIYQGYEKEYNEKDEPNFGICSNNSSYYSFTKHMCEKLLKNTNAITLRIRMPFNGEVTGKNLIYKVFKYDNIIDLKNSGTNVNDLCEFIHNLLNHSKLKDISGPLNVINPGPITCKMISEYLSFHGLTNSKWQIVELDRLDIVAQRSNCILSDKKIKSLGIRLPFAAKSLKESVAEFVENYAKLPKTKTS
jgi:dTDP-4-dehydrorhamnose reductase